jgi:hypothetical protein
MRLVPESSGTARGGRAAGAYALRCVYYFGYRGAAEGAQKTSTASYCGGHMEIIFKVIKAFLFSFMLGAFVTSPVFATARVAVQTLGTALQKASSTEPEHAKGADVLPGQGCADTTELDRAIQAGNSAKQALNDELTKYNDEITRYKNLQIALTSGLVAALLTAIGAVITLLVTSRNSKPERDLKRLEVVEKSAQMRSKGIDIPSDIAEEYLVAGATVEHEVVQSRI